LTNCRPIFDPTINYIARRAALTSCAQKYDTRPKMDEIEPKNDEELDFEDLECCEVACQVLPHLVSSIPTLEEWEQTRIAGKR
jgi:hypothetical protein